MNSELKSIEINGTALKLRVPDHSGYSPVLFMLHGWTGNENSMWVFSNKIPRNYVLIAPRGPYSTPFGGYGWTETHPDTRVWQVDDFLPGVELIESLIDELPGYIDVEFSSFNLMGFSQGAALAYSVAILKPERVNTLACLAGFLPENASDYLNETNIAGLRTFISHGTRDQIVPIERGRQAARLLRNAGAKVTFCEDDVGHKLSASCFHGIEHFYNEK